MYRRLRLKKLKIGDDAIVDLQEFSLKSKREHRSKVHHLEEMGIHMFAYQPPVPDGFIAQLKVVSDQWLEIPGRRERGFTLGRTEVTERRWHSTLRAGGRSDRLRREIKKCPGAIQIFALASNM